MGMLALLLACLLLASPMSAAHAGDAKTASSSRDVWLKRAQSNADAFMTGMASWYGADFHNKKTASGEGYDMYTFTAAHRTLPIGTVVRVTDKSNGKSVMVCVTDRGPYVRGRIIDLSYAAAQQINMNDRGVGKVDLEVVSDPSGTPLQNGQAYFVRWTTPTTSALPLPFSGRPERPFFWPSACPNSLVFPLFLGQCRKS